MLKDLGVMAACSSGQGIIKSTECCVVFIVSGAG